MRKRIFELKTPNDLAILLMLIAKISGGNNPRTRIINNAAFLCLLSNQHKEMTNEITTDMIAVMADTIRELLNAVLNVSLFSIVEYNIKEDVELYFIDNEKMVTTGKASIAMTKDIKNGNIFI